MVQKASIMMFAVGALTAITFGVTYPMSSLLGQIPDHQYVPFLSSTIDYAPTSCVGTFGISMIGVLLIPLLFLKHIMLIYKLKHVYNESTANEDTHRGMSDLLSDNQDEVVKNERCLSNCSGVALVIGTMSFTCMLGVGGFQFHHANDVHNLFAFMFFSLGAVHTFMVSFIERKLVKAGCVRRVFPTKLRLFLAVLSLLGVFVFVGFMVAYRLTLFDWTHNVSASFEIFSVTAFFFFFISYIPDFNDFDVLISVQPRPTSAYTQLPRFEEPGWVN